MLTQEDDADKRWSLIEEQQCYSEVVAVLILVSSWSVARVFEINLMLTGLYSG
jgi:hypothetical protein